MKYFFFTLFVSLFSPTAIAQEILVIDKNDNNGLIFDYSDPTSLVSLLRSNYFYLSMFEKTGVAVEDYAQLSDEQREGLMFFMSSPGDVPLLDEDPNSPSFGEPVIVESPDGTLSFLFEAPDTMYTDLDGITRIILELNSEEGGILERFEKMHFCKNYGDNYMVVLSLWDDAILTLDGFSYFESVSEADRAILLAGDSYWDQLRSDNLKNEGDIKSPLLFGNPENNLDYLLTPEYESSVVNSYNIELPVKYHVYDYDVSILGSKIKFPYSSFEHNSLEQLELLESHFDSVYYYTYQPDLPMIYDNPDDPLFGEPVTKVDSATGLISFVYPPTEFVTYWIDYNPQFIVQRQFQNTDELNLVSTHLVLLEQSNGDLNYVGFQKLDEDWRAYLDMLIYENPWTSFRAEMHDLLMGGKKVTLDKQKHRDKLNMSPSFWKRYNLN